MNSAKSPLPYHFAGMHQNSKTINKQVGLLVKFDNGYPETNHKQRDCQ